MKEGNSEGWRRVVMREEEDYSEKWRRATVRDRGGLR